MSFPHYLHTGQRRCHGDDGSEVPCAGCGQDASFGVGTSWPQPRFDLRNDEVTDRLTGLIWCRNANLAEFPLTWQEALDFVATMNREQRNASHNFQFGPLQIRVNHSHRFKVTLYFLALINLTMTLLFAQIHK